MGSLVTILTVLAPLLKSLGDIATQAIEANATNDQATLDALHARAVALADSLKPTGV